jgi:hypothetical protein
MAERTAADFQHGGTPTAADFDGLPGGVIGWNERTSDVNGISSAAIQIMQEDVTVNPSRLIEIAVKCETIGNDPAGLYKPAIRVLRDGTLLDRFTFIEPAAGYSTTVAFSVWDKGPSAGVHQYAVEAVSDYSGSDDDDTFRVIVNPGIECRMVVKDVGPWPL